MGEQCKTSDISIIQQVTGKQGPWGTEFQVVVSNNCECAQFELVIGCPGFNPGAPEDTRWIHRLGNGDCLINSGYAIIRGFPIIFFYESNTQLLFTPKTSDIRC
ncbi:hypothetical protein BVC80_1837g272 [Macleaya cordata]|uniref:Uncharacterized protein n=1 Tax=Macleaya cordata TaxID=56857 RepID=A0A200R417_MACCD|nr:hypothetical protein BVC80_1837g272 [Macleaya cordata]